MSFHDPRGGAAGGAARGGAACCIVVKMGCGSALGAAAHRAELWCVRPACQRRRPAGRGPAQYAASTGRGARHAPARAGARRGARMHRMCMCMLHKENSST